MCTATYLPISKTEFVLTHNRDEHTDRIIALNPQLFIVHDVSLYFPKDPQGNGTWFVTAKNNFTLCLLNGAFVKHIPQPPYAKSRGLVVLDFFLYNNVQAFSESYSFLNIEPFTLLIIDHTQNVSLHQIIWDGNILDVQILDASKPHLWCSVTLYNWEQIKNRKQWFVSWLDFQKDDAPNNIFDFHKGTPDSSQEGFIINRPDNKQTVSITSVVQTKQQKQMLYLDLINQKKYSINLSDA